MIVISPRIFNTLGVYGFDPRLPAKGEPDLQLADVRFVITTEA